MLLQNKNAVIYGAAGSIGSAVAKGFAAAGANVFLTGRTKRSLEKVADEIKSSGGKADVAIVDAMDVNDIDDHLRKLLAATGSLDISFNATATNVIQNIPLTGLSPDDYMEPVTQMLRTRFLTAVAAGRIMAKQGSGVILSLTATPGGIGYAYTGGFAPACAAIENLACNLAAELGIYGIRVVNMRSGGSPDSAVFKNAIQQDPENMKHALDRLKTDTMLKKLPLMADIANLAVFLSSDLAQTITGVTVDITCGTTSALNHHVKIKAREASTLSL